MSMTIKSAANLILLGAVVHMVSAQNKPPLVATLAVLQSQWVLGQPVELQLIVTNQSSTVVKTSLELDPEFGDVSVFVSTDGSHFRQYLGPDWGTVDISRVTTLPPGASKHATISVLWNNDLYRKSDATGQFLGFSGAGTYSVKAKVLTGLGPIESNSINVALLSPTGVDEDVWEAIRNNSRLARFIQDPKPGEADSDKLEREVTRLVNTYPAATHSADMRKTLDKYSKRKEQMQKVQPH